MNSPPADLFGRILAGLRPLIPRALLDGSGWERLLNRVGRLPGRATAAACGFEFRLSESEPAADFFISIEQGLPLEHHFIRAGEAARPDSPEAALARHLGPNSGFRTGLSNGLMLEYDIAAVELSSFGPPGVFLRLRDGDGPAADAPQEATAGRVADLLADMAGLAPDRDERRAVERAFAALPAGGRVIQAGAFPGRTPRALRLVARNIAAPDIADYLARLGQPDPAAALPAVLAALRGVAKVSWIDLDIAAGHVSPRVGLEIGPVETDGEPGDWLRTALREWRPVIDRVEAAGWCLPEKALGLEAWPGRDTVFSSRGVFYMYRGINHLKIAIEGEAVRAKAYVGMTYGPVGAASAGGE